jgi:hypothetical protein
MAWRSTETGRREAGSRSAPNARQASRSTLLGGRLCIWSSGQGRTAPFRDAVARVRNKQNSRT